MVSSFPVLALMTSPIGENTDNDNRVYHVTRGTSWPASQTRSRRPSLPRDGGRTLVWNCFVALIFLISSRREQALAGNSSLVDPSCRDLCTRCIPRGRIGYWPQR